MRATLLPLLLSAALLAGCAGRSASSQPGSSSQPPAASGSAPEGPSQSGSGEAPPPADSSFQVQVDWSVLEDGASQPLPAVGNRWYADYTDTLIPRPDYGTLIPYAGARALVQDFTDPGYSYTVSLYGLMTADGTAVMDPVCTSVYRVSYAIDTGDSVSLPVLALEKGDGERGYPGSGSLLALAAADGSWCTDFAYWGCAASPTALLAGNGEGLYLLAPGTGEAVKEWSWSELGIADPGGVPWFTGDAYSTVQWAGDRFFLGCFGENWEEARFLDPMTGEVTTSSAQDWYTDLEQRLQSGAQTWWDVTDNGDGTCTLTMGEESRTIPAPLDTGDNLPYVSGGDRVVFEDGKGSFAVTDLEGKVILSPREGALSVLQSDWEGGGSWLAVCAGTEPFWEVYTWNGALSATVQGDGESWCSMAGDLLEVRSPHMAAYYRPEDGTCLRRVWFGLPG